MPNKRVNATVRVFTKSVNEETREVEQIVSVFDNLDLGRDTVKAGAFVNSLAEWAASGDPIPVIWSHEWDNPFAHIGAVLEAKELAAGDPLLAGTPIADLGGLYTRYKVDTAEENPFAGQVFLLLKTRRVREASFAYDIIREKRNPDGTTDLLDLGLIEVGPTLKGMNPMTQLLAVKAAGRAKLIAAICKANPSIDEAALTAIFDTADPDGAKVSSHTFIPLEEDPTRCSWPGCGLTRNTLNHLNTLSSDADGAKAVVQLSGSIETVADAFHDAASDYVRGNDMANGGLYDLVCEGTFPDENRAVYRVEGWSDPYDGGYLAEFNFDTVEGDLVVTDYTIVEIEATVVPAKSRGRNIARKSTTHTAKTSTVAAITDTPTPEKVKSEEPTPAKDKEPTHGEKSASTGEASRALLDLDTLELT